VLHLLLLLLLLLLWRHRRRCVLHLQMLRCLRLALVLHVLVLHVLHLG